MQETVQTLTEARDDAARSFKDLEGKIARARLEGDDKALERLRGRRDAALRDADETNGAIVLAAEREQRAREDAEVERKREVAKEVERVRAERLEAAARVPATRTGGIMTTEPTSRKISEILRAIREETLIPQPDFQRRAIWTNKDKSAFVDTIHRGLPFPEIYVAAGEVNTETGDATELLVDGQQRVRTIDEYFRAAKTLRLSDGVPEYQQLSEDEKKAFLNYDVAVRNLGIVSMDDIREIFKRINATSYDLNEIERFNAVYLGEFKSFAERISQEEFFENYKLFSLADFRRMRDVSFVASLIVTMLSDYFHRDDQLEEYLSQYNEEFSEKDDIERRFKSTLVTIDSLDLDRKNRAFRKADFYSLFIEIDRVKNREGREIDAPALGQALAEFYNKVDASREEPSGEDGVANYFDATLQSTNDRSQRIIRGSVIRQIIEASASQPKML